MLIANEIHEFGSQQKLFEFRKDDERLWVPIEDPRYELVDGAHYCKEFHYNPSSLKISGKDMDFHLRVCWKKNIDRSTFIQTVQMDFEKPKSPFIYKRN